MRNSRDIFIVPIDKTFTEIKVIAEFANFQLGATEGDMYITFYDINNTFVERKIVHIPPEIYSQWGTDDNFIIDYAFSQLGVERLPDNIVSS